MSFARLMHLRQRGKRKIRDHLKKTGHRTRLTKLDTLSDLRTYAAQGHTAIVTHHK